MTSKGVVERLRATGGKGQCGKLKAEAADRIETLERALSDLVSAKALAEVRSIVAGWNGENRPDGPYTSRHPDRLGAQLPKTTCGAIYALDEAMQRARAALSPSTNGARNSVKSP